MADGRLSPSMKFLIFTFLFMASSCHEHPTSPNTYAESNALLEKAHASAKERMLEALNCTDSNITGDAMRELTELEEAGKENLDMAVSKPSLFPGVVHFWTEKMEKVIKPYLEPDWYQGEVMDFRPTIGDPTSNTTEAYKAAELDIVNTVSETATDLAAGLKAYVTHFTPYWITLKRVTAAGWARLEAKRAYDFSLANLKAMAQWAKKEAAEGKFKKEKFTIGITILRKQYRERLYEVKKQYHKSI